MPIIGIVLLIAAILIFRAMSKNGMFSSKRCRWKIDNFRAQDTLVRYVCQECGVDAYTSNGKPPKDCKRQYRTGRL